MGIIGCWRFCDHTLEGSNTPDQTPEYIVIENLKIMNGRDDYTFTGRDGFTGYNSNCAAVFIESGNHITIRNCELFTSN